MPTRYQGRSQIKDFYDQVGGLYADFGFKPEDTKVLIVTPNQVFAEYTHAKAVGTGRRIHHLFAGRLVAERGAGGAAGRIFGISHIGNVDQQVAQVGTLVDSLLATMKATGESFASMAHRHLTPTEVVTFIESVFPSAADGEVSQALAERRADVTELVWRGVGAELAMSETDGQPNPWACYNAVTEYFDHVVTGKAKTNNATRIANTSALFGSGSAFKLSALRQAQALVAA